MSSQLKTAVVIDDSNIVQGNTIDAANHTTPLGQTETQLRSGQASVSSGDTHLKHLEDAIVGTSGKTKVTKQNSGANENLAIDLDAAAVTSGYIPTANGSGGWSWAAAGGGGAAPIDVTATAGETLAERDYVYLNESAGTWFKVDTDASPVKCSRIRGIVNESGGIASAGTGSVRLLGEVSGFTGLTAWGVVYASTTAGALTQTRPSPTSGGAQVAVIEVGVAISTTNIVLLPPQPVQYMLRDSVANDGTLTILHHADDMGHRREVEAYVGSSESAVTLEEYTSGNQDSARALRTSPLRQSLVSWWSLDEVSGTRNDSHGTNHLTDNNTVGSVAGKQSNAADFIPANTEYLSVADNATLDSGDIDLTLACWVKLDAKATGMGIIGRWTTSQSEYAVLYSSSLDRFLFLVKEGTGTYSAIANNLGSPSTGTWYFIVGWHNAASNTLNIQVNNGTVDSTAHTIGITVSSEPVEFGRASFSGTYGYLDGQIDEALLSKKVFSSDEKAAIYNSGSGIAYSDTSTALSKEKLAQTVAIGAGEAIGTASLYLKKVGSPTGTLTLRMETVDGSNNPTGTLVHADATATLSESALSSSYVLEEFTFAGSFTPGAGTYALVLSTDRSPSETNYVDWGCDASAPSYANGEGKSYDGSSWSNESVDFIFNVTSAGTTFNEPAVVGRWGGGTRDVAVRYDDGSGNNKPTNTTAKNVIGSTVDLTIVVEVP